MITIETELSYQNTVNASKIFTPIKMKKNRLKTIISYILRQFRVTDVKANKKTLETQILSTMSFVLKTRNTRRCFLQ